MAAAAIWQPWRAAAACRWAAGPQWLAAGGRAVPHSVVQYMPCCSSCKPRARVLSDGRQQCRHVPVGTGALRTMHTHTFSLPMLFGVAQFTDIISQSDVLRFLHKHRGRLGAGLLDATLQQARLAWPLGAARCLQQGRPAQGGGSMALLLRQLAATAGAGTLGALGPGAGVQRGASRASC